MSDRMRPVPFRELLLRIVAELRAKGSVFDIPREHFWVPRKAQAARIFSSEAANPVGPAAGPHTQLAQNIVAAWLTGGRYIELKTVQKLDALTVDKPCIDAADEGYNVEWSTELSLDQAYDEYLKAWFLVHALPSLVGGEPAAGGATATLFNMSVGYDLAGIKSGPMDRFIGRLMDTASEPLFARYQSDLEDAGVAAAVIESIPPRVCRSVTLSTMHGCPPGEIESICAYMIVEKKLDTLVKLNPTLLGHGRASEMLQKLGYGYVQLSPEGFAKDLSYEDAVPMLTRLLALGKKEGRHFGAKLSNTLAAANTRGALPGTDMYMSGRALYPLTISLAAGLARDFQGALPMSFCGGAAAWNIGPLLDAGVRPITVATELLKPGGYSRLTQLARAAEDHAAAWGGGRVDARRLAEAAAAALTAPQARKDFRGTHVVSVGKPLPLYDCFVAPCIHACPIHQDVPEYIHLVGEGRHADALDAILKRNPLPFMTSYLCDQACAGNCTRLDWEGALRIRDMKKAGSEGGYAALRAGGRLAAHTAAARGVKAAVIGAGPAGLAAACFLAREGFEAHVFEREQEAGGIVRYVLPHFRIPKGAVEKDVELARAQGVVFHFGERGTLSVGALKARGYPHVLVAIGAEKDRDVGIEGATDVLSFLRSFRADPKSPRLGERVVVIGAGDTAMDAARAAKRCRGVRHVSVVYRRTEREMPASPDEYRSAREEGISFHFLRAPVRWSALEGLVCSIMTMGAPDASGRSTPVATGREEIILARSVITAVGAEVDATTLAALGVTGNGEEPAAFVIGDALHGPETIVKAIASARAAVDAVCARENGNRAPAWRLPAEDPRRLRALRDRIRPPAQEPAAESRRCLGCRALCLKCVEVCPNRANTTVRTAVKLDDGFHDDLQIVHLDALCNECGTCATFCPWEGKPYRDKLTVFAGEEDFRDSSNPGFFLAGGRGLVRCGGVVSTLAWSASGGTQADGTDVKTRTLIDEIARNNSWLLGGTQ